MIVSTLVLALCLTSQTGHASKNFFDSGLSFYNEVLTNDFDFALLRELAPLHKNVLISPISLKLILGLLYQGSSSITEREFQSVLKFENKESVRNTFSNVLAALQNSGRSEYLLNIGTSMFLEKELNVKHSFEQIATKYFRTSIKPIEFSKPEEASKTINEWIEQITHGKVKKLVSKDDLLQTIMLITNAVYFKGTWEHPFPKNQTFLGKFLVSDDYSQPMKTSKYVKYMTTTDNFYFYEDRSLDAKIIRLEYKGSSYAMFIVLPNSLGGLDNVIKKINLSKISNARYNLEEEVVQLTIPKFKFNFYAKLEHILKKFELHQIFENTNSLTGIVEANSSLRRQLVVSDIVQKTGIEVDEEGSTIFSATDVNIGNKFGENKIIFNATHPFMFFIEGPNGTILFMGKYEDPEEMEAAELGNRWSNEEQQDANNGDTYENTQSAHPNVQTSLNNNNNGGFGGSNQYVPNDPYPQIPNLSPNLDPDSYQPEDATLEETAYRFNLFDIELLNAFADSHENVLISPASIKTTLAMILEGARGNCAQEIGNALRIQDINQRGVRNILIELLNNLNEKGTSNTFLESHNGIFTSNKHRLLDSYQRIIAKYYKADFKSLDFANKQHSANVINQWASDSTHGAINEVISPQLISEESAVIISNALYFKGKWKTSFDPRSTNPKCFYTSAKQCVKVNMMHISDNFNYNYIVKIKAYIVDIPYQEKFSMLLILPSPDTNVENVIRDLNTHRVSDLINNLNNSEIVLELPRFKFDYSVDLVEYLKPLKVRDIFGVKANLSGIVEGSNAKVDSLLHKTKIEVDEIGTVAAASTSAMIIPLMQPLTVSADRPFIFLIYHQETKNVIFEGIVKNPLEQGNSNYYQGSGGNVLNVPKAPTQKNYNLRNRVRYQ